MESIFLEAPKKDIFQCQCFLVILLPTTRDCLENLNSPRSFDLVIFWRTCNFNAYLTSHTSFSYQENHNWHATKLSLAATWVRVLQLEWSTSFNSDIATSNAFFQQFYHVMHSNHRKMEKIRKIISTAKIMINRHSESFWHCFTMR